MKKIMETVEYSDNAVQYDIDDISTIDVLPAIYHKVPGVDSNPVISALPLKPDLLHVPLGITLPIATDEELREMDLETRYANINALSGIHIALPFYTELCDAVFSCLIGAYSHRNLCFTESYPEYEETVIGEVDDRSRIDGFSLIGPSGIGKSAAITELLRFFPKCIKHTLPSGIVFHQIPVLFVTAPAHSNLKAICDTIALKIDTILERHGRIKNDMRRANSLGSKFNLLADYVRVFNIGMIIIDEVQHISFNKTSEASFENFLTLSQETGVSIGVIGNEDAIAKIGATARMTARLDGKHHIDAGNYCQHPEILEVLIKTLWRYQWTEKRYALTKEIVNTLTDQSCGNVGLLVLILQEVQRLVIRKKEYSISSEAIKYSVEKRLSALRKLIIDGNDYTDEYRKTSAYLISKAEEDLKKTVTKSVTDSYLEMIKKCEENNYDRALAFDSVFRALKGNSNYPESAIRSAFCVAEKDPAFMKASESDRLKAVKKILKENSKKVPSITRFKKKDSSILNPALKELESAIL